MTVQEAIPMLKEVGAKLEWPKHSLLSPQEPGEVRYTRPLLEFLEGAGLVDGRYELIQGRILSKMGQNSPHSMTVTECFLYLAGIFPHRNVRTQATMEVREEDRVTNRPEPDVMILREATLIGAPSGNNVLLAVEIADTTHSSDFEEKPSLYARAGVAEYWVIDLPQRTLTAFRNPDAVTGTWASRNTLAETQQIAPESLPHHTTQISELLPPVA